MGFEVRTLRGHCTIEVEIVRSVERLRAVCDFVAAQTAWAYDTEGSGLKPQVGSRISGHCIGTRIDAARYYGFYVPVRSVGEHNAGWDLPLEPVNEQVARLLANPRPCYMSHAKFDIAMARADGIATKCPVVDVSILATAHDENEKSFKLKKLAEKYCSEKFARVSELEVDAFLRKDARGMKAPYKKRNKKHPDVPTYLERFGYSRVPVELLGKYGALDTFFTLWLGLEQYADTWARFPRLCEREHRVMWELHAMEWRGLPVDIGTVEQTGAKIDAEMQKLYAKAKEHFGEDFELSPEYLRGLFYDRLGLIPPKQTKGGKKPRKDGTLKPPLYAMDKEARLLLAHQYPDYAKQIGVVNKLTQLEKLRTTYYVGFKKNYSQSTGRVYPSYNQIETKDEGGVPVTGRLSSSDPNAQNQAKKPVHLSDCQCAKCIPEADWLAFCAGITRDRLLNTISVRRYFNVPKGKVRVYLDFSQIELRVLAWFSRDPRLLYCYANNFDVHQMTAVEVTDGDRDTAKQVNFGNNYGMTEIGLARRMVGYYADPKGTIERAKEVLRRFWITYAGIPVFRRRFAAAARKQNGFFMNPFDRPRRIPDLCSPRGFIREAAERKMMSSIISGTAADVMKISMLRCADVLRAETNYSEMCQTVHDELAFEFDLRDRWVPALVKCKQAMEDWPLFANDGVPILANAEITNTTWEEKRGLEIHPDGTFSLAA